MQNATTRAAVDYQAHQHDITATRTTLKPLQHKALSILMHRNTIKKQRVSRNTQHAETQA